MNDEQRQMLAEICARWHRDEVEAGLSQAIFDIGYLVGLLHEMEKHLSDLRQRVRESVLPE